MKGIQVLSPLSNLGRKGATLTEILIGIMILGVGVLSLATLFPLGLLRLKRGVNQVRGTVVARNGWNEVRVRNLLQEPLGPPAAYFSQYPTGVGQWPNFTFRPTTGPGVPVIIDPLMMSQNNLTIDAFGRADANLTGSGGPMTTVPTTWITGGEGLLRVSGGGSTGAISIDLASGIFSSPDDITYRSGVERTLPLQDLAAGGPPFLTPTNGVPFSPGALFRERRYTWIAIVRKVNSAQAYDPGADGVVGDPAPAPLPTLPPTPVVPYSIAGADDLLEDVGPDLTASTADDPARNLLGVPVAAPVGPFELTIVAFYTRDFASRETVYANPDLVDNTTGLATPDGIPDIPIFTKGLSLATLVRRTDVPLPEIPLESYIMDTTFDSTRPTIPPSTPPKGLRNAFVYRVKGKTLDPTGTVLTLALDQPARADGYVLTVLKGAVGVFDKQVQ